MISNYHHATGWGHRPFSSVFFLLIVALLYTGCSDRTPVELTFAFGPDDSGAVASLIDNFNQKNQGKIHVTWQQGSRLSNEFFREIEKDFSSDTPIIDVVGSDVVWTSAFANAGWVEDLTSQFYDEYENDDFVEGALNSTIYQSKIWGVPWYTDAGILYYRKDLLATNGFDHPPATWKELADMAKTVMTNNKVKAGYVFQGANYEGGVVNACELIWNADGNILISDLSSGSTVDEASSDVNIITINSAAAKQGLTEVSNLIMNGIVPREVAEYKELDTRRAFADGETVFMRDWPTAYPLLLKGAADLEASQIGVAALPVSKPGLRSYSCLGGWNMMINNRISDEKKDAAWTFIQFMTDARQQKQLALEGGTLPSLNKLYLDEKFLAQAPMADMAREVIQHTRVRPVTPKYMELAPDMAWTFNEVLKGSLNPTEAIETMQGQMEGVLAAN
ncbi:MAG: ABC transporter substrate-binding protein [Saprospiraceae bacterium]